MSNTTRRDRLTNWLSTKRQNARDRLTDAPSVFSGTVLYAGGLYMTYTFLYVDLMILNAGTTVLQYSANGISTAASTAFKFFALPGDMFERNAWKIITRKAPLTPMNVAKVLGPLALALGIAYGVRRARRYLDNRRSTSTDEDVTDDDPYYVESTIEDEAQNSAPADD